MKKVSKFIPSWFLILIVISSMIIMQGLLKQNCQNGANNCSFNPFFQTNQEILKGQKLYDCLWLDKVPQMTHDEFHAYSFTSDNVGLNLHGHSVYKVTLEAFEFKASKSDLRFHFPHDGKQGKASYTIEKLAQPTDHFDYKLTIKGDPRSGDGTKVYYTGPDFRTVANTPFAAKKVLENHLAKIACDSCSDLSQQCPKTFCDSCASTATSECTKTNCELCEASCDSCSDLAQQCPKTFCDSCASTATSECTKTDCGLCNN